MFLLSLASLSSWACIVGDNLFTITCSLGGNGNESKHAFSPASTTSYRGVDPAFSNDDLQEYIFGFNITLLSHDGMDARVKFMLMKALPIV